MILMYQETGEKYGLPRLRVGPPSPSLGRDGSRIEGVICRGRNHGQDRRGGGGGELQSALRARSWERLCGDKGGVESAT